LSVLFTLAAVSGVAVSSYPCSPEFPPACVWQQREDVYFEMPDANFASELAFHYGAEFAAAAGAVSVLPETLLDIESVDVLEALEGSPMPDERKRALLETYRKVRSITRAFIRPVPPREFYDGRVDASAGKPDSASISSFDFAVFRPLLKELPEEFSLYAEGAAYYHLGDFKRATVLWQALLDLPPEQRHYRSVWAAYMLGKASLHLGTASAIPYFERARTLDAEGFSDSVSLCTDSLGWQAQAEALVGEYQSSLLHYMEQYRTATPAERRYIPNSIDFVCRAMFRAGQPPEAVVRDPLCREVITLWVLSRRAGPDRAKAWSEAMVSTPPEGPVAQAGRLAQLYYEAGQMELAGRWIALADPDDAIGRWVHSKLLLREGKLAEAESVLDGLVAAVHEQALALPSSDGWNDTTRWHLPTPGLPENNLGMVRLSLDDYAGAMEAFLAAGSVFDASYIADQVMTSKELEAFLREHPGEFPALSGWAAHWQKLPTAELLRYVLARKLARAGEFTNARLFYPEYLTLPGEGKNTLPLHAIMDAYAESLHTARDSKLAKRVRVDALFDAASISRTWGMELIGTEHAPDWRLFNGKYKPRGQTRVQAGAATTKEAARVAANAPVPNRRFHYRSFGPEFLWEAATLLPDNDERTAQALWYGGRWRPPHSDPDKFYKALVRRCRKLPIGKEADELRWFPPKPESWGKFEFDGVLPRPSTSE